MPACHRGAAAETLRLAVFDYLDDPQLIDAGNQRVWWFSRNPPSMPEARIATIVCTRSTLRRIMYQPENPAVG